MNSGIISLSAGLLSFAYFVTLTGFRRFSCETTSIQDAAMDGLLSVGLLAVCVAAKDREETHIHAVLGLTAYVLARLQYKKHVVGKKFKKVDLSSGVFIVTGSNAGIGLSVLS